MKKIIFTLTLCVASSIAMAEAPPGHPKVTEADRALHRTGALAALPNTGKVLEVIDAGAYTYLNVENQGEVSWIAGNNVQVNKGDVVSYSKGSNMRNFHSKTLDRTFPEILFTAKIRVESLHPTAASPGGGQIIVPEGSAQEGHVLSTMDSGGYTYIKVDQNGQTHWLAAPKVLVKEGDTVRYRDGTEMTNFYSKTLNREFLKLIFLGGLQVVGQ